MNWLFGRLRGLFVLIRTQSLANRRWKCNCPSSEQLNDIAHRQGKGVYVKGVMLLRVWTGYRDLIKGNAVSG